MKKKMLAKKFKSVLAALLVPTLVAGMILIPEAEAATVTPTTQAKEEGKFDASYIQKVENLKADYTQYLDNSKMFELPEGVGAEEEISVIITVDTVTIMDAYDGTDKTMSFSEYALHSDDATEIKNEISRDKAQVLSKLDKMNV